MATKTRSTRPTAGGKLVGVLAKEAAGSVAGGRNVAARAAASSSVLMEAAHAVASSSVDMVSTLATNAAKASLTAVNKAKPGARDAELRAAAVDAASAEIRMVHPTLDDTRVRNLALSVASAVVGLRNE